MPARNEAATIVDVIERTMEGLAVSLPARDAMLKAFVVADLCCDETAALAEEAGALVLVTTEEESGLGAAFRLGVRAALDWGADVIVHIDGDGQYKAADARALLRRYATTPVDIVVGDRLWSRPPAMSRGRFLANRLASWLILLGLNSPRIDTQSGLRVFSAAVANEGRLRENFTYAQEQIIVALRQGFTAFSEPIEFLPRQDGLSRLIRSKRKYAFRVVRCVLRTRASDLKSLGFWRTCPPEVHRQAPYDWRGPR